jgi:carbon storage regulator
MLVLTRIKDESLMIGDDVEVTVIEVRNGKVRLGVEAPRGVAVHRKEVWLNIQGDQDGDSKES